MSEWTENFENELKVQIDKVERLKVGYINVRLFNNTAKKIDELAPSCEICKQFKNDYDLLLPNVVKDVEKSSFRSDYERKLISVSDHLKKEHGVISRNYFSSLYSLFGLALGLLLGTVIVYLIQEDQMYIGMLYGGVLGIIAGRFMGLFKDKKMNAKGKSV